MSERDWDALWDDEQIAGLRQGIETALVKIRLRHDLLRWWPVRGWVESAAKKTAARLTPKMMSEFGVRALTRTDIIHYVAETIGAQSYLEIGVSDPSDNFDRVQIAHKDGVDPAGRCNFPVPSDEFFAHNARVYDLIFIDGLHLAEQVLRDVENSLRYLSPRGVILLHDCNPVEEAQQIETYDGKSLWCGTVWTAISVLRMTRAELWMGTVNADHGVGVITRGEQTLFPRSDRQELNYAFLDRHRRELLHLLSWREFRSKFTAHISSD
ncbi:MAG: class I SAM-dependent methyltransferase [bacterium]|nr:class I SAM-dependent methyltransferase [bacterium]